MFRPGKVLAFSLLLFGCTSIGHGQVVSFTPEVSSTQASPVSTPVVEQSPSLVDFTILNWQMAQLSPYSRSTLISSSATSSILKSMSVPNATNPFVGATIGMTGGITASTKPTSTTSLPPSTLSIQPISGISTTKLTSVYSTSRFVSYAELTPDYGVNNRLIMRTEGNVGITVPNDPLSADMSRFASVPEPSTWMLLGGLLAFVGYGYARIRTKQTGPSGAVAAVSQETPRAHAT